MANSPVGGISGSSSKEYEAAVAGGAKTVTVPGPNAQFRVPAGRSRMFAVIQGGEHIPGPMFVTAQTQAASPAGNQTASPASAGKSVGTGGNSGHPGVRGMMKATPAGGAKNIPRLSNAPQSVTK